MKTHPFLSKSKYLSGLQCHKLLWHQYNAKDEIPEVDAATQAIFDQGHIVGEYAKKIFPGGIEVAPGVVDPVKAIEETEKLFTTKKMTSLEEMSSLQRKPLFEAAFKYKNAYARVDILNPVKLDKKRSPTGAFGDDESLGFPPGARGNDVSLGFPPSTQKMADAENGKSFGDDDGFIEAWDIIEVKSSTSVKDVNLHDLALQWYTYSGAGLSLNKCYLMHINNQYVRKGEIDPKKLFIKEDITDQVLEYLPQVENDLEEMVKVIARKKSPEIQIGPHCSDPYECVMTDVCWKFLPKHNPFTLYRFKSETAFSLVEQGVTNVLSFDGDITLNDKQQIQINSIRSKKPYIDKVGIKSFLDELVYPLYYLDFETIGPALPLFNDSRPYEQIPFQFSLHIQQKPGAKPEHISFLAEGNEDPRPELLRLLKKHLGTNGSIVTYNASFEKDKLNKATGVFAEYKKWNNGIQERIVDLLDPFRSFYYYHPSQMGSASIKSVLPAITGKGYEGMEISDGGTASNEYLRVTFGENVSDAERKKVRKNLEEYCELDTMGMVRIMDELRKIVN